MKLSQLFTIDVTNHKDYKHNEQDLQKQTRLLNKIAVFTIFTIGIYMIIHIILKSGFIAIIFDGAYIVTSLLILYFQSKKYYQAAYFTTGIGYTIAFACSSILIGSQNQIEYLIFVSTLGTTLLFKEQLTKSIFFIFGFTVFVGLKIFHVIEPQGLLGVNFSPIFSVLNGIIVFGVVYFIVYTALGNAESSLDKLHIKNEEVTQLNKTLEQKVEERTQEIQQKSKALEQSNKELKRFSYIAAHDLREPLRNIIGFSQLMNKDIVRKKYDKIDEYSGYIDWAARRIDTITRDIVDYTELEDRIEDVDFIDLSVVVENVARFQFEKRKDIVFYTDDLPTIQINEVLITMLFTQLIENAVQYCDKPQPVISIHYSNNKSFHNFKIVDNGIGIAPEYHEKIFVMFKRLHNDIQKNGSGIGLSISKKIVEGYGGQIGLKSKIDEGSTFYFTIPK